LITEPSVRSFMGWSQANPGVTVRAAQDKQE
jgi:hypothetical protein